MTTAEERGAAGPASRGFFDLQVDERAGTVRLGIREFGSHFLLSTGLPRGMGLSGSVPPDLELDRGSQSAARLVEFRRSGPRVYLVAVNSDYTAGTDGVWGSDSFPESVLWSADVLTEEDGVVTVDGASLAVLDLHGVGEKLRREGQGTYTVDRDRSFALAEGTKTFDDNTQLCAVVTFAGPGEAGGVKQVVPSPAAITLVQEVNLVRLPDDGYRPLPHHPRRGGYGKGYVDVASFGVGESAEKRFQMRFRLARAGVGATAAVAEPIVFYVDPAMPEPWRSAAVEGGNWWRDAFEQAGLRDAFRVEVLPEGKDPGNIHTNMVWWSHHHGISWSWGFPVYDPRTGEILKGNVRLASSLIERTAAFAEAVLRPYDGKTALATEDAIRDYVLRRVKQVAAHEIGHSLGFMHNFASHRHPSSSVMDYPHPSIRRLPDGDITFGAGDHAGLGPWDYALVKHAYGDGDALAAQAGPGAGEELLYLSNEVEGTQAIAHAYAATWVVAGEPVEGLASVLAVRERALADFSAGALHPRRQSGELGERFLLLYLMHRYQAASVASLVGGVRYRYSLAGDGGLGTSPVPADAQKRALQALSGLFAADVLALPESALNVLTPSGRGYGEARSYAPLGRECALNPLAAVDVAATTVAQQLLTPRRLMKVTWQSAADPEVPGVREVVRCVLDATWNREVAEGVRGGAVIQDVSNWAALRVLAGVLADPQLHPEVASAVRAELQAEAARLDGEWKDSRQRDSRAAAKAFIASCLSSRDAWLLEPAVVPPGGQV